MTQVRLQKFLAECGTGSRRKMEQFIKEGRVQVNGQVVTELGRKIDPSVDRVEVNRRPVRMAPKGILLLNKPRGVVSTLSDPEGRRTVSDFLTKHYTSYFPVGRLDWDSTGLMILTNDGEMAERLMHPRFEFERVYEARVEGSVNEAVLDKLRSGIRLSDGFVQADAEIMSSDSNSTWLQVKIKEGRNRVVRRIFDKLGHPVMKLKRTVYGPFKIGRLQVGQVRVLTAKEYLQVRHKVMTFKGESESPKEREGAPKRFERSERPERSERSGRSERSERPRRFDRSERSERPRRFEKSERSDRPERSERFDRSERPERSGRSGRPDRRPFGDKRTGSRDKRRSGPREGGRDERRSPRPRKGNEEGSQRRRSERPFRPRRAPRK